jgi:DNA-binding NtrC family response regulator
MKKRVSILIVDDDPGMTDTVTDILGDMDYDVTLAEDGFKAIKMIRERAYDVALIDIKMPGINGVETFKEVKGVRPSTEEALRNNAYACLEKPLDMDKVVALVKEINRGRREGTLEKPNRR